jgi:alkylation response protein AidB-like acyl-CoA dehydrogenase
VPDFAIVFAVTGIEEDARADGKRRPRKRITAFLVDRGTPGFKMRRGPRCVSYRAYCNFELAFSDCRVPAAQILGEEGQGFALANEWLADGRVLVAATCCGKAERHQFGQAIGRFQGVGFKLADMATELRCADLLTLNTAWRLAQGRMTSGDAAMAKVFASEAAERAAYSALQVHGAMGYTREHDLHLYGLRAWALALAHGDAAVHRERVAAELFGGPAPRYP